MGWQNVYAGWTVNIDGEFSRLATDDGFIVFERGTRRLFCVAYSIDRARPEDVIQEYLNPRLPVSIPKEFHQALKRADSSPFPYENDQNLAGHASVEDLHDSRFFEGLVGSIGTVLELHSTIHEECDLEWLLTVWRSARHEPRGWERTAEKGGDAVVRLANAFPGLYGVDAAIKALRGTPARDAANAMLIEALGDESTCIRENACIALEKLGRRNRTTREALARTMLEDAAPIVRAMATETLWCFGAPEQAILPTLLDILVSTDDERLPDGDDRVQGPCQQPIIPARYHAARLLSYLGPNAAPARDQLLRALGDASGFVRVQAAEALVSLGEPHRMVVPAVRDTMYSTQMADRERVSAAAWLAERELVLEEVVDTVAQIVTNAQWSATAEGLDVLARLGPRAAAAVPQIKSLLEHEDRSVCIRAKETLAAIERS